ncbi:LmeA family phospholipid-binding protein [Spirulina major]|uniref:LmeA family phospholipid-binding protein n=1 Tax=Spirulina major TaxID=270636 RepID=UPI0015877BB4|nr:DUF2993 domain-containing protein [Spirulina major]
MSNPYILRKHTVLLLNPQNLGEQAINKIAALAFSRQISTAQTLSVKVKTDPTLLAQGELESLFIDGVGLVMRQDLRMEQMQLQMNKIKVSPFKALLGNIELTQPIEGTGCIVLTESDFNRAFHTPELSDRITALGLDLANLQATFSDRHSFTIACTLRDLPTLTLPVAIAIDPNCGVLLSLAPLPEPYRILQPLVTLLRDQAQAVFNLRTFELHGISLAIQSLSFANQQVTLKAIAAMTHFPS